MLKRSDILGFSLQKADQVGNTAALSFYRKQGYEADEIDPTRMEEDDDGEEDDDDETDGKGSDEGWEEVSREEAVIVDYVILSKALRRPVFG